MKGVHNFFSSVKMPPNSEKQESVQYEEDNVERIAPQAGPRTYKVSYRVVLVYVYWHIAGLYGAYLLPEAKWQTIVFTVATLWLSILGVTAGAHRLWSHQSYKVNRPLEIFLMLCQSMSCQNSAIHWVRDHRLHHKYTDTDADPHNSIRGFFYSHCGWLLVEKHPEVAKKSKTIDVSDIFNNPVLLFQQKYIKELTVLTAVALPTLIPMVCWGETFNCAWHLSYLRLIINLNLTFLINSANHAYGHKPYDKHITATNNVYLSIMPTGETYHNYHHTFPLDYRTSELGNTFANFTTIFIDICAKLGWAWDLKAVSEDMLKKRMARTGDGTDLWGKKIDQGTQAPVSQ
ncbi:acyl-CoA Delta(11) desaturase-like isoform X1 [Choristoneura fumiferana]|uniref:acyl-CoA Delta(11) desaturase-like isoform X1 n=2 Tax=Choristoneura fumiferana TaxID=7141 RepID=UPI003D155E40